MSVTGLREFDHTVHATNLWLKEVMEELDWNDRHRAYHALRSVLQTLRDRLPVQEVLHLSSQLPMLIRGFFLEGWRITDARKERSKDEFLATITDSFLGDDDANPTEITHAVLKVMSKHVTPGEMKDIKGSLSSDLQKLWDWDAAA